MSSPTTDIKKILEESTKDVLTEQVRTEIQEAFENEVNTRVQLHVEKALAEMDVELTGKVTTLLEAIDKDHSAKLDKVVAAITENHTTKLKQVVEMSKKTLNEDATTFKNTIVESISNYLDTYIDSVIPVETINEAVKNKRAYDLLTKFRGVLAINEAVSLEAVKPAIEDGKKQIDTLTESNKALLKERDELAKKFERVQTQNILLEKTASMPDDKKKYIVKMLSDKSPKFITENFEYSVSLFDKSEEKRLVELKNDAMKNTASFDVKNETINESVNEPKNDTQEVENKNNPVSVYLNELKKNK